KKDDHTAKILKRVAPKLPVLVFGNQRGKRTTIFCYTNGTWFQVVGREKDGDIRWGFTHGEPYLRRTFCGTTDELQKIVVEGLAAKAKAPEPNEKEPPGFGPEVKQESPKSKIQNPKSENASNTKDTAAAGVSGSDFGFRISDFGFSEDFGFHRGPLFAVIPTL